MADYKKHLKAAILIDSKIITYQLLSRSLKVHVNQAKEMLYDFHTSQNSKKPGSIHATYIITGFRKILGKNGAKTKTEEEEGEKEGEDSVMQSSPFEFSQGSVVSPSEEKGENGKPTVVRSVVLVAQEGLGEAKEKFERITSLHVYSLEAAPLKDLIVLAGCSAEVLAQSARENQSVMGATYGTIRNPSATRRGNKAPPPPPPPAAARATSKTTTAPKPKPKEETPEIETKEKKPDTKTSASTTTTKSTVSTASKGHVKVAPKRNQSNIMSMFGNPPPSKKKSKEPESRSVSASAAQSPPAETEEPSTRMEVDSDDDDGTEEVPTPPIRDTAEDIKKRKQREDELLKMMEDEDEEDDVKMLDEPPMSAQPQHVEEPQNVSTVVGGRRRGKRRVMKRVSAREEGYLVTKIESTWESYSEDEPEPPKPKPTKTVLIKGKGKNTKGTAAAGQGNIASFFTKK